MGSQLSCINVSPAAFVDERLRVSHTSATCTSRMSSSTIKFLHCETTGCAISELDGPLTAAEAMLEFPACFLSHLPRAATSCGSAAQPRISAVPADEELRASQLYLVLPMHRLNTRFSLQEMAFFAIVQATPSSGTGKHAIDNTRAFSKGIAGPFPACAARTGAISHSAQTSDCEGRTGVRRTFSFKQLQGMSAPALNMALGAAKLRSGTMCRSKSWTPKLDTVEEYLVAV